MKTKILTLGLVFFLVFIYCEKQLSTGPDIPDFKPVKINYFSASAEHILLGQSSILSWSTSNASKVLMFCDDGVRMFRPGIAVVEKTGTMEVWPDRTTIYMLTASPMQGSESVSKTLWVTVE